MLNINGNTAPEWPPEWAAAHRALYYGDGLFESIACIDGRMPLFEKHIDRLFRGLSFLGIDLPPHWNLKFFETECLKTLPSVRARIRISVWRTRGGLYRPHDNSPFYFIESQTVDYQPLETQPTLALVGVGRQIRLPIDAFSHLKTLNAGRYVAAAREAAAQGWNDMLLLNSRDRVCEAVGGNVFWIKEGVWHSPPLSEGCIAGVMRAHLFEKYSVVESVATIESLANADRLFLTNAVRGILPVARLYIDQDRIVDFSDYDVKIAF